MKKFMVTALACSVLFVACNKQAPAPSDDTSTEQPTGDYTVTYELDVDASQKDRTDELIEASQRMIERRLSAISQAADEIKAYKDGRKHMLGLKLNSKETADFLTEKLTEDLAIDFMKQAPLEEADRIIAETEGYAFTNLQAQHVEWLSVQEGSEVTVLVEFTEDGAKKKRDLLKEEFGKFIGMFVRGQPVYKFLVQPEDVNTDTLVMKVQDPILAFVFTDDVNTGLHVSFTPVE